MYVVDVWYDFGRGGGGVRSMGSCVYCREGLVWLRMNRFEILKWDIEIRFE